MSRKELSIFCLLTSVIWVSAESVIAQKTHTIAPQNVLWISIDDQSPWYGTYGDEIVATPNIDQFAAQGVVFERAYAPTPVCSPSRSAIITGSYSIRLGTHDHRSGRVPGYQIKLPEDLRTLPEIFRAAGYETYNSDKDDFNFSYDREKLYSLANPNYSSVMQGKTKKRIAAASSANAESPRRDDNAVLGQSQDKRKAALKNIDWRDVPDGKPFFGQMSLAGGKRVGNIALELERLGLTPISPKDVKVPEQYPDIPQVRQHLADHYNSIQRTDYQLGQIMQRLEDDGLWNKTIMFLYSDHGSDLPRSKEFCYSEGLHVPLIVVAPGLANVVVPGARRDDPVNLIDIASASLELSGLVSPKSMDARNLFAKEYSREVVFSSADRMSNVIDRVRSVMGYRYHYIRNFFTDRPLMNWGHREMLALPNPEETSFLMIRRLAEEGKLTDAQAAPYGPRAAEELYDLHRDPNELINLANDPAYAAVLEMKRGHLRSWLESTGDRGQYARSVAAMREITDRYPESWLRSPEFIDK